MLADELLDVAASRPHGFGRIPSADPRNRRFPLAAALHPRAAASAPARRRWYLRRAWQLDQGQTPECVAHAGKHWEFARPTERRVKDAGIDVHALYRRCKAIDGYPTEDGTDANALLKVYRELGQVESWWWYTGQADGDLEVLRLWVLTRGACWLGAGWSESMFTPELDGTLRVEGALEYGHEVLLVGYDRPADRWELCNSWGVGWGRQGRAYLRGEDLARLLTDGGDACGVLECRPA